MRGVGLDDLGSRAGRHRWGYTGPGEAAWELLEECVAPYLEDLTRRLELGLEADALAICQGIVLGMYRIRNEEGGDVLGWAPDFPLETASHAVGTYYAGLARRATGRARRKRHAFPEGWASECVPAWKDLVECA